MWYSIWPAELSRHAGKPDMQHMHAFAGDSSAQHLVLPSPAPGLPTDDAPCSSWLVITRCSSWLWHAPYIPDTVLHWGNWTALGRGGSMSMAMSDFAGSGADLQHCCSELCPFGIIRPQAQADQWHVSVFRGERKLCCEPSLGWELPLGSLIWSFRVAISLDH